MTLPTPPDEHTALLENGDDLIKHDASLSLWGEICGLFFSTLPITISFALQNIFQAFSTLMAGSLGSFELEVAAYGYMFASCTGAMVAVGGATALDTLCGQAITSAATRNDKAILGVYFKQSLFVLSAIFIFVIGPIWVFSGHIFVALGQEREFALATGEFMRALMVAGLAQVIAECFKKFLQVQGESNIVGWSIAAASAMGAIGNFVLIRFTRLGIWSCPAAFTMYQLVIVILLAGTVYSKPEIRKSVGASTHSLFKGCLAVVNYAVTGILTVATEWWSFEILAIFAARLPPDSIGAQSIIMSSDLILTTVSLGLGVAASHRIGNLLGAGQGKMARKAAFSPYLLSWIIGVVEAVVIISVRHQYGYIFTRNEEVVKTTATVLPLMAFFQFLDSANGGAGGVLRGAGKNHLCGICNLIAYYGVGLTTAWWLCFHLGYGLFGLWAGIITGSFFLLVIQSICIFTLPWDRLAEEISSQENSE